MKQRDGVYIDLEALFWVVWKNLVPIILSGMAGGLLVLLICRYYVTPLYQASKKIYILNRVEGKNLTYNDIYVSSFLSQDYTELITCQEVLEKSAKIVGIDSSYEELLLRVGVNASDRGDRTLTILARDPDPYKAYDLVNAVFEVAKEHIGQVVEDDIVTVVEDADIPVYRTRPRTKRNTLLGAMAGSGLCLLVFLALQLRDDTIKTVREVETYLGLHVLGSVPMNAKKKGKAARWRR